METSTQENKMEILMELGTKEVLTESTMGTTTPATSMETRMDC